MRRESSGLVIGIIARQMVKTLWRQITANLFGYFANDGLQIRFTRLALAAEQAYLARLENAGDVVTLLKE
jgi:hypothetical protein